MPTKIFVRKIDLLRIQAHRHTLAQAALDIDEVPITPYEQVLITSKYNILKRLEVVKTWHDPYLETVSIKVVGTVMLEREALQSGILPSQHIAHRRGISLSQARRHLQEAAHACFDPENDIVKIYDLRKAVPRRCTSCGVITPDGTKALCWTCHNRLILRNEWTPVSVREVNTMIHEANLKHLQQVRNQFNLAI